MLLDSNKFISFEVVKKVSIRKLQSKFHNLKFQVFQER